MEILMDNSSLLNKFGGRRYVLVMVCGLTYTALLVGNYLDPGAYVALQMATVAAYIAGNGMQKYTEKKYGSGNCSCTPN